MMRLWHRSSERSSKLTQVPGIGPLPASALVVSIGDVKNFDGCRHLTYAVNKPRPLHHLHKLRGYVPM
ncbi:transposase [Curvibacter lanceolatus]|uniref:transposase n=1 Tax=Curvibacter lanceolatus TaxID=86182 RepID=UPI000A073771